MSQYGDTNPHFWPQLPSDNSAPPHIQPEPRQDWDEHLYHPDVIPPRSRQRQSSPHPPPSTIRPTRTPPELRQDGDGPLYHPDVIQPRSRQRQSSPRPPPPTIHPTRTPSENLQPQSPQRHRPPTPPKNHRQTSSPRRQQPVTFPYPADGSDFAQTYTPANPQVRPKPQSHPPRPQHVSFEQGPHLLPHEDLMYPQPSKTKPITWFGAVFCVILWLVIILGGLLVLIIYLVYRPRTPHFEISSASLNAAYLDMGYLLNSDITVLANFTNPNKKVNVDFSYVILQLYFEKHLIANQYIEPFSAFSKESKLANVEFISSQIRLPITVTQQLITQVQRNRVTFGVDGIFHARSNFGSLFRYSYWLYGHCQIEMTGPPGGVMLTSHCRTKD